MSRFFMEKEIFETGLILEKIVLKYIVDNNIDFGVEIDNNIKKDGKSNKIWKKSSLLHPALHSMAVKLLVNI